jgi:glycosyltransferase involved in cell wall biosynthesis
MLMGYGVDLVTDQLAEGLSHRGHSVTVYCSFQDGTYRHRSYTIKLVPARGSRSAKAYESAALHAIRPHIDEPDVWIIESFPFFSAGMIITQPWVAFDHGVVPSEYFDWRRRRHFDYIRRTQYKEYFTKASKIVCVSEFLRSCLPPSLRRTCVVIPPGINHYANTGITDVRAILNIEGTVALYVGRSSDTTPYKGVDELISIWKGVSKRNVRLLISTSCSLDEEQRLKSLGVEVVNGAYPEFMPAIFGAADLFVTATRWEGFDLPLLEASYFGLPAVAFRIGAHPEVVLDQKTGFLAGGARDFEGYFERLCSDPMLRKQMGDAGREFAAGFTWEKSVRNWSDILRGLS